MNRPRQVAYRQLAVHRPDGTAVSPQPGTRSAGFGHLLRRPRRVSTGRAESVEPHAGTVDTAAEGVLHDDQDVGRHDPSPSDGDADRDGEDDAPTGADDVDWPQSLLPTSGSLDPLLAGVAAIDRNGSAHALGGVSRLIADFCNERSVDDSEGWTVRIELRPDVLEQATLELTISSYWLLLRFRTPHPASRRLILDHEDALRQQLSRLLRRQRDISISVD